MKEQYFEKPEFMATQDWVLNNILASDILDEHDKSVAQGIHVGVKYASEHYANLDEFFRTRDFDKEALFGLGVDIGHDINSNNRSPRARILSYLGTMHAIGALHHGVDRNLGQGKHTAMIDYAGLMVVDKLPQSNLTNALFNAINVSLQRIATVSDSDVGRAIYGAHRIYLDALYIKYGANTDIKRIAGQYDIPDLSDDEYRDLKEKATLLTVEAMRHRKYGTKSAYTGASIGGSWIFHDGQEWAHKAAGSGIRKPHGVYKQYSNVAAIVQYSPESSFNDLRIKLTKTDSGVRVVGGLEGKVDATFCIGMDGAISADPDGLEDLALVGIGHTQELALRAEIAAYFYDLSMPVMKHRPEEKTVRNGIDSSKRGFNPIQDLLIPRIKYFEKAEDYQGPDDITHTIREHDVTWFVRLLPEGWHASPEAVAEAEAHGIELAQNETFVKAHTRGRANKVLGYHAIRHSNPGDPTRSSF